MGKPSAHSVVRIIHTFTTGDQVDVIVQAADSYPDSLNQARAEAVRGLRESIRVVLEETSAEPAEDDGA